MEREQFTFYGSFAKAAMRIRKKADRCDFYDAIVGYALREELPDLDRLSDAAALGFEVVKPILDSSRRKATSGKKGGTAEANSKQGEIESKPEARENRKQVKEQVKGQVKEQEKEKGQMSITPLAPLTVQKREELLISAMDNHSNELLAAVRDWLKYKAERREPYQETGLKALLSQIRNNAEKYGDSAMADVIRRSMSANYRGIVFDWLRKEQQKTRQYTTAAEYVPPKPTENAKDIWAKVDSI